MKALFFTHIYPSLRDPTRGPYNYSIFQAIAQRCEARVFSPEPWWTRIRRPQELFSAPREGHPGMEVVRPAFWSLPRVPSLHARCMYLSLRSQVADTRRDFAFDVIFAPWAYPDAVAASLLAREFDCPLVVKILGSDINVLPRVPALRKQIRQGLERAYRVVTVSAALQERVIDLGISPDKVLVQHNGVDGEAFIISDKGAARADLGLSKDRPLLCFVGRLGHEKGLDILLDAMHLLRRDGRTDIELALVGCGELESVLRSQARSLQIESQVRFVGVRPHAEVARWITACDVLCLPSRMEGCPNVILEALASGRPVVASRVGGIPEILNERNGILVPAEDSEALAHSLQAALERSWDPVQLRNSVECLSWDMVGAKYYKILCSAVEEHKSAGLSVQSTPYGRSEIEASVPVAVPGRAGNEK